ncbi:MAG: imelysin family protein [Pseudomonadota bacterium]
MSLTGGYTKFLTALGAVAFSSAAQAQVELTEEAAAELTGAIISDQIAPAHQAFAAAAGNLSNTVADYCDAGTGDLEEVRATFHETYDGWMAVSWVNFGPQSLFMRPIRVHFWPDSRNSLGRQLGGLLREPREDLLDPETLASASVALQGLPALERLLYGDEPLGEAAYTCQLAVAIADNVESIGSDLAEAWSDQEQLDGILSLDVALASTMFQTIYEQFELIVSRKLAPAIGATVEEARPRLAENWRSGRAIQNIAANLQALLGVIENGQETGFADLLRTNDAGADIANDLVTELDAALALAWMLQETPIADLVSDDDARAELITMGEHINAAREIWATEVGAGLGLNIGFNSLDGD